MGLDVTISTVVGIPLKSFGRMSHGSKVVTKYHQDTGKAYEITQPTHTLHYGINEVATDQNELNDAVAEVLPDELDLFPTSPYEDDGYVGVLVAEADASGEVAESTLEQIKYAYEEAKRIFKELGITETPKVYSIPFFGA